MSLGGSRATQEIETKLAGILDTPTHKIDLIEFSQRMLGTIGYCLRAWRLVPNHSTGYTEPMVLQVALEPEEAEHLVKVLSIELFGVDPSETELGELIERSQDFKEKIVEDMVKPATLEEAESKVDINRAVLEGWLDKHQNELSYPLFRLFIRLQKSIDFADELNATMEEHAAGAPSATAGGAWEAGGCDGPVPKEGDVAEVTAEEPKESEVGKGVPEE